MALDINDDVSEDKGVEDRVAYERVDDGIDAEARAEIVPRSYGVVGINPPAETGRVAEESGDGFRLSVEVREDDEAAE
eukprot:CAMPEP_0174705220 /NCGR_PEP_ID=MMETSP1094-20130205/8525_1 /TAXON_ID=156173 /ORGANISM="Chrysochromulina brevifilum, Strain UTEX LB 985" /LENGTH=77 /DNA_ID=CAMNT_0015903353 /DNA_START=1352 /DNA_END=1585 /DNA_ORIENTATION=-